jgi:hypothetical protein
MERGDIVILVRCQSPQTRKCSCHTVVGWRAQSLTSAYERRLDSDAISQLAKYLFLGASFYRLRHHVNPL